METGKNPFFHPSFSLKNRLGRAAWGLACALFFATSPRPLHAWRSWLLRLFGARMGANCHIYPKADIWAPWNLTCKDNVVVGNGAVIYNPKRITLGSFSTVSQDSYLCGASHDYNDPDFPLVSQEIVLGDHAWICARATVQMGVTVGEGAVLGLGSLATKDLEPWQVYGGIPAKKLKPRVRHHENRHRRH